MANFLDILASLLGGQGGGGNMLSPSAMGPNAMDRQPAMAMGAGPAAQYPVEAAGGPKPGDIKRGPDGQTYQYAETRGMQGSTGDYGWIRYNGAAPAAPPSQSPSAGPAQSQGAPAAPGGGIMSRLMGGGNEGGLNGNAAWLVKQGMDPVLAKSLAGNPKAFSGFMAEYAEMKMKPDEYQQRATWAMKLGFKQGSPEFQRITLGLDPSGGGSSSPWSKMDDGRLFNQQTGETRDVGQPAGGGGQFTGTSVEAQALNAMVAAGEITAAEARQLAAGKSITNPADGSLIFMTPQGIFGRDANGGPPQPLGQTPAAPTGAEPPPPAVPGGVSPTAPTAPTVPGAAPRRPGQIPLTGGKPGKLTTEGERRNQSLYSVVEPELAIVEENFSALTDTKNQLYSNLPMSELATTPEYQRAHNSLKTIIASYLYSTSGATANPGEVENQATILMPKPFEAKESVEDKRQRVRTMVNAIKLAGGEKTSPTHPAPAPAQPPADGVIDYSDYFKGK